jgi:hypothetical protein
MWWLWMSCAGPDTDGVAPNTDSGALVWEGCPDAGAYVGDAGWVGRAEVTSRALYCSASNEGRTLEQELAAKAMLRVVRGAYPLPTVAGEVGLALPVCVNRPPGFSVPTMEDQGVTNVTPQSFGGTTYTYLEGDQPLTDADARWALHYTMVLAGPDGEAPPPLTLDGQENDDPSGAGAAFALVADGAAVTDLATRAFGPCDDDDWQDNVHRVVFSGGDIELHLHLGRNTILTGPAVVASAMGTLDGAPFTVNDFYRLLYRPDHHHFGRHFAVLFDAPVGDVCGLRVEAVDTQPDTVTAVVHTVRCDLSTIEARTVASESFSIAPR